MCSRPRAPRGHRELCQTLHRCRRPGLRWAVGAPRGTVYPERIRLDGSGGHWWFAPGPAGPVTSLGPGRVVCRAGDQVARCPVDLTAAHIAVAYVQVSLLALASTHYF